MSGRERQFGIQATVNAHRPAHERMASAPNLKSYQCLGCLGRGGRTRR